MARSRWLFCGLVCAFALWALPVQGQYVIQKVGPGDGDPSGATVAGGTVDNVSQPCVSSNGLVAYRGDTEATSDDDLIYLGDMLIVESGIVAVGTGGDFDSLDTFTTSRHVNANGDIVYSSTLQNVMPVSTDDHGLHVNNTLIFQEGQTAPGLPDTRLFADFFWPAILDDGRIAFRADLDGSTTDDGVLYFDGAPVMANALTMLREGTTFVGGPLDSEIIGTAAFNEVDWNNNGDVILDLDLEGATTTDDVLLIKRAGMDYEVPLRAGQTVTVPTGDVPFESISQVRINDNGDWVINSFVDTATNEDAVVFASLGGGAPQVIIQEDGDASAATGVPLTQFGFINGVAINNAGDILILCNVDDDPSNPITYDEAIFLYSGGVLTLITTDEIAIPAGQLTDISSSTLALANDGTIIFEGTADGLDAIFEAYIPNVIPVSDVVCDHVSGTADIDVSWTNGQTYTAIRVVVNGVAQVPDLAGTETSTTITGLAGGTVNEICIIGLDGADPSPEFCCSTGVPSVPDVAICATPALPILDSTVATDILNVPNDLNIADMYVEVKITHTFLADLDPLSITSPTGTTLLLMADEGGSSDNVHTFFTDSGAAFDSIPFNQGLFMQAQGPGSFGDFYCEQAMGDWTLTVGDDAGGDQGTLDEWCLGFDAQLNPALDCCPKPTDLLCSATGPCGGGGIVLEWVNNSSYFSLELVREDSMGGIVTIPLAATDTSYTDPTTTFGEEYTYRLDFVCASGGATNQGPSCTLVADDAVPPVTDLVCSPDFCANEVTISWNTNGVPYDSVSLFRAGVMIADVTGVSTFTDDTPSVGPTTYAVVADCGGVTSQEICTVDLVFEGPTDFGCEADLMTGDVVITWTNNATYTVLELRRNGALVSPQPMIGDTSYTDTSPDAGCSTYELTTGCAGFTSTLECSIASFDPTRDYLMIPESSNDTVGLYDAECGAYVGDIIVNDPMLFSLSTPINAVLGPDGNIYLSDQISDAVFQFDRDGNFLGIFAEMGLDNIRGIDFVPSSGNLLVSDNNYVAQFAPDGTPLPNFIDPVDAFDVVTLPDDRVLVNDISIDEVRLYETDGITFAVVVPNLSFPEQTTQLENGNYAVIDFTDDTITEFDLAGTIIQTYAVQDQGRGVHSLTNGNIIYTNNAGVWVLDPVSGVSTQIRDGISARFIELLPGDTPLGPFFVRGDCNADGNQDISDAIALLSGLFVPGTPPPACQVSCDFNDDGAVDISDAIFGLSALFVPGSPPPSAPNPDCGIDPTPDALTCDSFPPCP